MKKIVLMVLITLMAAGCSVITGSETSPTEAEPTTAPTDPPADEGTDPTNAPPVEESTGGEQTFTIVGEESQAQFVIDEVLNGEDTTISGVAPSVSGLFTTDYSDTSATSFEPITVTVDGIETDNGFRNRAIRDVILQTGQFATVTFTPTSIEGLPEQVTVGETYDVTITGDLAIKESTQEVTFEGTVTPTAPDRIEGAFSTTIIYEEFGVTIPRLPPQVASVEPDTRLELDFVATSN